MGETIDLDDIERKAKAATPGPWRIVGDDDDADRVNEIVGPEGYLSEAIVETDHGCYGPRRNDAEHICAVDPAAVLELIRLARLGKKLEAAMLAEQKEGPEAG